MRAFIVLCLVAFACADKLGYNYQPVAHSDSGLSFQPGSGSGSLSGFGSGAPGFGSGSSFGPVSSGGPSYGSSNLGGPISSGNNAYSAPAEYQKEFYTFEAPDADFNDVQAAQQAANGIKKNLQVIFIRNPENRGLEDALLNLARQAGEKRTAIYVLNKQPDFGDLANKLNAAQNQNAQKPEVHFVKYRTPEDAANAQRAIQSQYDSLGGPSSSHNGGVAPVLNFASAAPSRGVAAPLAPASSYLPASIFRLRLR